MTSQAALVAVVELALLLAVVAAYVVMARRARLLWHPLSIVAMLRRSAIGGFGWGVIIAAAVWIGRRVLGSWMKRA